MLAQATFSEDSKDSVDGTLVFTGNSGAQNNTKHREFFFYKRSSVELVVDDRVMRGFTAILGNLRDNAMALATPGPRLGRAEEKDQCGRESAFH